VAKAAVTKPALRIQRVAGVTNTTQGKLKAYAFLTGTTLPELVGVILTEWSATHEVKVTK
jgi:hypothetical protein